MTTRNDSGTSGGELTPDMTPTVPRRKRLALPFGVVLALCIFMPALRVCGTPTYPISMPPFWSPYVLGALVAALAAARTRGGMRGLVIAIASVVAVTAFGWGVVAMSSIEGAAIGVAILAFGVAFVVTVRKGPVEERAARATIGVGIMCTPWFTLLAFDPDGMWGAWVSLVASLALIFAGLDWRRRLRLARADQDAIPRAIARAA